MDEVVVARVFRGLLAGDGDEDEGVRVGQVVGQLAEALEGGGDDVERQVGQAADAGAVDLGEVKVLVALVVVDDEDVEGGDEEEAALFLVEREGAGPAEGLDEG